MGCVIIETNKAYLPMCLILLFSSLSAILERCSFVRVGNTTHPMTSDLRSSIMDHVKEYGTGSDTLRCLALGVVDQPMDPDNMDLSDASKFVKYEVLTFEPDFFLFSSIFIMQ